MFKDFVYDVEDPMQVSFQSHLKNIYLKLTIAMLITAVTSIFLYRLIGTGSYLEEILFNPFSMIVVGILELMLAVVFKPLVMKVKPIVAEVLLYLYSFLTGISFSTIFIVYDIGVIATAFIFTAVLFGCCSIIGYSTHIDLSKIGGLLFVGLITLLLLSVASIFIPILRDSLLISYLGVIIFLLYTAYDVQIIRNMYESTKYNYELSDKFASYGAFQLYIDFINLFLKILQIFARSKSEK